MTACIHIDLETWIRRRHPNVKDPIAHAHNMHRVFTSTDGYAEIDKLLDQAAWYAIEADQIFDTLEDQGLLK